MIKRLRELFSITALSLTICLTFLVAPIFLIGPSFLEIVELKTRHLRFRSRGTIQAGDAILLAVIDEKGLDKEGRWAWPRSKIARLIDYLSDDGAKVIAFDVGFLEPDETNNLPFIQQPESEIKIGSLQLESGELERLLHESTLMADNDLLLANAIKRSKTKVLLGDFSHTSQQGVGYEIERETINAHIAQITGSRYPITQFSQEDTAIYAFVEAYSPEVNLPIIDQAADSAGYFNMFPDLDGVVRWIPLIIKCGMVQELEGLNKKRVSQRKKPLDVGIGVNTNPVVVGNIGSEKSFDYTVMGCSVNLGSRLGGANKNYKISIVILVSLPMRG